MYNLYKMLYMKEFHHPKIYGVGKIGPKGQVVIPVEARKELSLDPGERVVVMNIPRKQGLLVVNEELFNEHLEHLRDHFGSFDGLVNEYKKHLKEETPDA